MKNSFRSPAPISLLSILQILKVDALLLNAVGGKAAVGATDHLALAVAVAARAVRLLPILVRLAFLGATES